MFTLSATLLCAQAQLAITEVMTQESTNNSLGKGSDWWELSNFGSSDIDLTGYRWNDDAHNGALGADPSPFTGVIIHQGEAIIVTETNAAIHDAATFRQWWGIGAGVQVLVCPSTAPGLSQSGDSVRIWNPNAAGASDQFDDADMVDRVDTGAAPLIMVPTFNYDTNNGTFDWLSTNGVRGAFNAATSDEVGSPGVHTAAGPIVIVKQPTPKTLTAPVGIPVSFSVAAIGLPKPRFIWLFNGSPANLGALGATVYSAFTNNQSVSTISFASVQTLDQGTYSVIVSNGVQANLTSSNAVLTVTASPLAPEVSSAPQSVWAYIPQSVTFSVDAFGSPSPTLQWKHNGVNISGETFPDLVLFLSDSNAAGTYTVGITNSAGFTNVSATLTITPKPNLRITEVEPNEAPGGHGDWWELSNLGTFPVSLHGFRFDDSSFSLAQAYTITNDILIAPNESVVLAEDMTPADFATWWGPDQLPPGLQIIDYHGAGLSFSSAGDSLSVWNAAASTESDYIDSVAFDVSESGVTFTYDPSTGNFAGTTNDSAGISVVGVNGAFTAAISGDIGSPGSVVNTPLITRIGKANPGYTLTWVSQPNFRYAVQYKTNLVDASWSTLTTVTVGNTNQFSYTDGTATGKQRFYRLILNP